MKLVTFCTRDDPAERVGVLKDSGVMLLPGVRDMNQLIVEGLPDVVHDGVDIPLDQVTLLSPIPRPMQDVLCLGLNYADHRKESRSFNAEDFKLEKDLPVYFSKRVSYSQGTGAPIPAHSDVTKELDYECELAVIIGRDALNVTEEEAGQYVFGYTVLNDVTARDLQHAHKQWHFGKSLEGFAPMGPCIVTAEEIAFPPALELTCTVNGELRQHSNTELLIHTIPEIISQLSHGFTLKAGSIIATGTPSGVGMGRGEFLQPGDVVTCAIEGIGALTNTVE
ncbi:MAG: fumarylacetoacetate hydrolase family protein [Ruminococcaceae bacterium]|jgi:2-keto-4-pentenoate hydratase/2-oxohepta-3-ene-1,7-dioic acid hydratase in catechol pathway|nr:fumarylacetoacetate hydrolase family protein [Oscillospiraceae bacterium]